jgi:hypothetical protein
MVLESVNAINLEYFLFLIKELSFENFPVSNITLLVSAIGITHEITQLITI